MPVPKKSGTNLSGSRQSSLYEYGRGFPGGESLLLDPERQDLGYGNTSSLTTSLVEVSRLLNAIQRLSWLRTPDFHIPKGYQGRSPCLVRRCVPRARSLTRDSRPSRITRKSHGPGVPDR